MDPDGSATQSPGGPDGTKRPTVSLIGCGVSGMFFLHAVASRHKQQIEQGREDVVLPSVVCFERADEPGGCWRSPPNKDKELPHNLSCWYDDVWSNTCKETFELPDYTFQDHFKSEVPTFLPRKPLLNYLVQRTLTADPDLYQQNTAAPRSGLDAPLHEVRFGTAVTSVVFDKEKNGFTVTSTPMAIPDGNMTDHDEQGPGDQQRKSDRKETKQEEGAGGDVRIENFDYCIWAAGLRGLPRLPRSLLKVLQTGFLGETDNEDVNEEGVPVPFRGSILHSIQMSSPDFVGAVQNKRIVIVGDSNSAEDLSLQSLKWGVEKVYVLSRSGYRDCVYMGSWPGTKRDDGTVERKVEVHIGMPYRIVGDGHTVKCCPIIWNHEQEAYELDDDEDEIVLENIDSVIFCTGYVSNKGFLSPELRVETDRIMSYTWSAPADFRMKENALTPDIGHVQPSAELSLSGNIIPGLYRTVLISNPKMMYLMDVNSELPVLQLEAFARLSLAYITKEAVLPNTEDMESEIQSQMMDEMNIAYLRWSMDRNFFDALDELGDDHWSDNYDDARSTELNREFMEYYCRIFAR